MKILFKFGLAVIRDNKLLVLEPNETPTFKKEKLGYCIMPGGVKEKDETPEESLKKEIREELSAELDVQSLKFFGRFKAVAAGKKDTLIEEDVYLGEVIGEIKPKEEIKSAVWFGKNDDKKNSFIFDQRPYHSIPS